jgi:hypothetical protein
VHSRFCAHVSLVYEALPRSGLRPGVYAGSRERREHGEPGSPGFSRPGLSHLRVAKAHSEKARKRAFQSLVAHVPPDLKGRAYDRCAAKPRERGWGNQVSSRNYGLHP